MSEEETDAEPEQAETTAEEIPFVGSELLTETEARVLRAVLEGGDPAATAKDGGLMLSAAIDSINEKLFDVFFDTAIEFDEDVPVTVEDYIEELKGYAGI